MSRLLRTVLLALVVAAPSQGFADRYDTLEKGPRAGETIPPSLSARDQNGKLRDIRSLAHRRGLVVLFSRSLGW